MRLYVLLACIPIILIVSPIMQFESAGADSKDSLTEGLCWTYQVTRRSESVGTGTYEGQATLVENSKGRVTVKRLNATTMVIEDLREVNQSSSGSGFFKQNMTAQIALTAVFSVDRRTLRVVSLKTVGDAMSGEYVYGSKEKAPAAYFVSTSLKRGQDVQYYWGGQVISCFVDEGTVTLHGSNISTTTLRYSGPKKVQIQTVTRFPEDGNAEATFHFEKTAGLLVFYTASEEAKTKGGACCAVTTTNTENYTIQSTSFWKTAESPQVQRPSPSAPASENMPPPALFEIQRSWYAADLKQGLILVSIAVVILVSLTYSIIRYRSGIDRSKKK